MRNELLNSTNYKNWLIEIKQRFQQAQIKAAVKVNSTLLEFYWELGADIVEKQKTATWGCGFLKQLSSDLMAEFPDVKGFSKRNLERIRKWVIFYSPIIATQVVPQLENSSTSKEVTTCYQNRNGKQAVSHFPELFQIPWGQNIVIISKCGSVEEALFYVHNTIENGWSRAVLTHQIESNLYKREGKATTNFELQLPKPLSDLANQLLKDPYNFDFLTLTKGFREKELEQGLIDHITQFLLELGSGFAYVGRQVELKVGERDFYIDLLFYHLKLRCYVVIELKAVEFEPEFAGKLNFYLNAVDGELKHEQDAPTIGLLLCKEKDKLVAEYALKNVNSPIGVSEYEITEALPENLKSVLPTVEEIETELENLGKGKNHE